ncbi:MAG: 3'-5' exonuclease [Chitinophagales bacterium]|nr:3'-5' exonuclease [Chitinophagales bacterium]MCC7056608.1 3'-5' exonuclease [Chitinophagales bacterium]
MIPLQRPLAILDLETTGLSLSSDRIVEICILKIIPSGEQVWFEQRINPTIPIPPKVSAIHGIYDHDVADKPTFAQLGQTIFDFLTNCDFGGYNSNFFDIPMLNEEFLRLELNLQLDSRKFVDVFRIFQKMEPRDLKAAYQFYCGKQLENAHSARADVAATWEVLQSQLEKYTQISRDMNDLHTFTAEDNRFVDLGRRMVYEGKDILFNFGKYKGQSVEKVLKENPQYYDWILKGDFLLDTKNKLREIMLRIKYNTK